MVHEIQVSQYKTVPSSIKLGTFDSYGTEQLHFTFGSGWEDLAVYATFTAPTGKSVQTAVDLEGYTDVPAEATAGEAGQGEIVLIGKAEGVNRITVTLHYTVLDHGPVQGAEPAVPTPDLLQQVLTLSKDAQKAAKNAEQSAANAVKDATDTVKPYKEEAAQAAAGAALSEKSAAESKVAAQKAAEVAAHAGIAAGNAADAAEKAAGVATDAAGSSALNAENAQKGAQNAQQSATDAAESQRAAKANADAAAKSQQSAATDAKTATDAKVAAAGSADNAAAAAGNAAGSKQEAGASEEKAAASERAAKESKLAAAKSAQAALESKNAAATSEENAAASAKKAQGVADSLPADYTTAVGEIAKLKTGKADKTELDTVKQKVESITPDDSTVGEKPWSSKNIVDMLCQPLEESGNPVVCYPVAGYPLDVKAKWEPMQEGSGTPYPAGGGKQLLDISKCEATIGKPYGVTITIDGDIFKVSGVPTAEVTETNDYSFAVASCEQEELRGKGYKVTAFAIKGKITGAWGLRTADESSLAISAELSPGVNTDIQFRLMVSKDTPTAWEPYENIRPIKGRESVKVERCGENLLNVTPFETYTKNGITYEYVPDGGIHISGTATVNSDSPRFPVWHLPPGKYNLLDVDKGASTRIVALKNGTKIYLSFTNNFDFPAGLITESLYIIVIAGTTIDKTVYPYIVPGTTAPTTYTPYIGQTNTLTLPETVYGGEVDAVSGEGTKNWRKIVYDGTESWNVRTANYTSYSLALPMRALTGFCTHFKKLLYDAIRPDTGTGETGCYLEFSSTAIFNVPYENVGDWKNFLAAQYAAGTPVYIVYQYANEVNEPFTSTGAQPLPALAGANTVLTDADSASVTGRADPIKRITDLEDAVASQT